jgi:RNA polymerase sigma factor (sigma-70 family)
MEVAAATVVQAVRGGQRSVELATAERRRVFEQALAERGTSLAKLAFCLCGNKEEAEDLCAEAFALAWPRWEAGKVEDLGPYLRQIVVNLCHKSWRRDVVRRRHEPQLATSVVGEVSISRDFDLIDAVLRLSPRLRTTVVLRFFEDLSEEETAALLSISTGTVKSRLSRALTILRSTYDGGSHA